MTPILALVASLACAVFTEPPLESSPEPSSSGGAEPADAAPAEADGVAEDAASGEAAEGGGLAAWEIPPSPGSIDPETGAYRISGWRVGMDDGDDFAFWGWDGAGARFAYETWYAGGGGAGCDMEAALTLVDAAADAYVTGAHQVFTYESPEGDECVGEDPQAQLEAARGPAFEAWGIQTVDVGVRGELVVEGETTWLTLPGGGRAEVQLTITGPGREDEATGAGYRLVLVKDGEALVVESGERLRPWFWEYAVEGAFYSEEAPRSAALIIKRVGRDFEGSRQSWMTNGAVLPEGW